MSEISCVAAMLNRVQIKYKYRAVLRMCVVVLDSYDNKKYNKYVIAEQVRTPD